MPIRLRLAVIVGLLVSVLVAGGGLLFTSRLVHDMRATLARTLRQRARRVDAQLLAHLLPLSAHPRPAPDQSIVQVLTDTGAVWYTTGAAGRSSLVGTSRFDAVVHTARQLQVDRAGWRNPRLVLAEPGPSGTGTVVVVGASLDQVLDSNGHVDLALLIGGPLVVLLSAAGAWLLAGRALEPVERLRARAAQISASDPSGLLPVPSTRDELAALASTLNDLLDAVHTSVRDQRHFVAAASHELRSPLAALHAGLEMASQPGAGPEALHDALGHAIVRVDQLVELTDRLLLVAQADDGALHLHTKPWPVGPIVADALELHRDRAERRGVLLVLDADPDASASVDEPLLRDVVANLLDNAVRHSPAGAAVEVSVRSGGHSPPTDTNGHSPPDRTNGHIPPTGAGITVRDHGFGFPPGFLPDAFKPFSRPDGARDRATGGAGLGLTIVQRIVEAHGGQVHLTNHPEGGAIVSVVLPAVDAPESPRP